jgi:hypothetical protein
MCNECRQTSPSNITLRGSSAYNLSASPPPPRETSRLVARRTTVYQQFSPGVSRSTSFTAFVSNIPPRPLSLSELPLALLLQNPWPLEAFRCHSSDLQQPSFFAYAQPWAFAHGSRGVHADVVKRKTPDVACTSPSDEKNTHRVYLCVYACIHAHANTLSNA